MANIGNFNAHEVDPAQEYQPLPPNDYIVQIVRSEWKQNSKQNGHYVELEMDVLDGEHTGKKVFDRLNLDNPNAQAVEIAQRTLSAICHATGVMQVADTEQLHFKPLVAKVKVTERKDKPGHYSNEIGAYKSVSQQGSAPAPQAPAAPPAQQQGYQQPPAGQQAANQGAAPPWAGGGQQAAGQGAAPPWKKTA
jgi:hypothetical protein